jgi:hypothetical protein
VFLLNQSLKQSNEAAEFFMNLQTLNVLSGVDATTRADNLPPERPPTIWTSSYHVYLQEQQQKEEEEQKKKKKKTLVQLGPLWENNLAGE